MSGLLVCHQKPCGLIDDLLQQGEPTGFDPLETQTNHAPHLSARSIGCLEWLIGFIGAPTPRPPIAAVVGIVCAVLSILLRFATAPYVGDGEALLTAFPLVLVASLAAGATGGWVCLVACTIASWYLFIGDALTFAFGPHEAGILVGTFLAGAFTIGVSALLRRAFREINGLRGTEALLSRELEHRIKNTLTLVVSIARQTFRKERAMESAFADFEGRMIALAAAQEFVGRRERKPAEVAQLVERSLAPFCGLSSVDRLTIEGPDACVDYDITIGLFLVLHELATNAAKYGALSVEAGEILIAWSLPDDGRRLDLTWTERGGPPVTPPASRGFGSKLIERIVTRSLGGSMTIDYPASGLEARLMLPLRGRRAPA